MPKKAFLIAAAAVMAGAAFTLPASAADERTPVRGAVVFWLLDRNNDGAVDKAEIDQLRAVIFDAVDANHDGRVTQDEFAAVMEHARAFGGERGWRGGPRQGHWREHGGRDGGPREADLAAHRSERMMDRLGIAGPEGLSKQDFLGRSSLLFDLGDEDNNGSVSRSEFDQTRGGIGRLILMD